MSLPQCERIPSVDSGLYYFKQVPCKIPETVYYTNQTFISSYIGDGDKYVDLVERLNVALDTRRAKSKEESKAYLGKSASQIKELSFLVKLMKKYFLYTSVISQTIQ